MAPSIALIVVGVVVPGVRSHGSLVLPPPWSDPGGAIGPRPRLHCTGTFSTCLWFNNYTTIPGAPTLPSHFWTYTRQFRWAEARPKGDCQQEPSHHLDLRPLQAEEEVEGNAIPPLQDYFARHPWRAPGSARLYSGCGVAGGNPEGCPPQAGPGEGANCPGGGYGYGPRAQQFPFRDIVTTPWTPGSVVEVGWGITANHGGGYSYRLCREGAQGRAGATEHCFQDTHLQFVGDFSWIEYGGDRRNRTRIPALRTQEGTHPPGSQWTRNPIPACAGVYGGFLDTDYQCREGLQFPAPGPGLFGFGVRIGGPAVFTFTIVDQVKIPDHLEPGNYVLSFRWDCEQTPQVWTACSSIQLLKP